MGTGRGEGYRSVMRTSIRKPALPTVRPNLPQRGQKGLLKTASFFDGYSAVNSHKWSCVAVPMASVKEQKGGRLDHHLDVVYVASVD